MVIMALDMPSYPYFYAWAAFYLFKNRYELGRNNPTAAVFCFDVQGHLSLGVDKVVERGMEAIIKEAEKKLIALEKEEPENKSNQNSL